MRELLRFAQRCGEAPLHPKTLEARVGAGRVALLRGLGLLIDREPPTTLPCGGMGDCQREIVAPRCDKSPWLAVCGADEPACEAQTLSRAELERVSVSMAGLAGLIAKLIGTEPSATQRIESSTAWSLGRVDGRAQLFAPSPFARSFVLLLLAQSGPTTVHVPSRERVPVALEQRYRVGERVELRFLEDELVVRDGRVLLQRAASENHARPAASTRLVLERAGERAVTDDEYTALLGSDAHLVLDLTTTSEHGGYTAHVRHDGKKRRAVPLPPKQAHAIVELVRAAGRPLRAAELRCLRDAEVRDPERLVEIARKAIDVPLGRYQWRAFQTVRGATPDAKAYAFRPPADMSYAVIVPAR